MMLLYTPYQLLGILPSVLGITLYVDYNKLGIIL